MAERRMDTESLTLVHEGAIFLDGVKPDWFKKINLKILNAGLLRECVLGQLYRGDFLKGRDELKLTWQDCTRLCFSSPRMSVYPAWTQAWKEEILLRRG